MCIGVPGQVLAVGDDIHQRERWEVCGIKRDVNIALICEGKASRSDGAIGDLFYVGFAMTSYDENGESHVRCAARRMRYDITSA